MACSTRLIADALRSAERERVFVTVYGVTLVRIRLLIAPLDAYVRREQLYAHGDADEDLQTGRENSGQSSPATSLRLSSVTR
jgi:hypothetical protein